MAAWRVLIQLVRAATRQLYMVWGVLLLILTATETGLEIHYQNLQLSQQMRSRPVPGRSHQIPHNSHRANRGQQ